MKISSVGILGIGAIGSVISSLLFENEQIELFHFNRSKKKEIKIKTPFEELSYLIDCQTVATKNKELDWLIICLKEHHYQNAKNWFEKLIDSRTKVVIIRNGLNLKTPILPFSDESQILECMIDCPTHLNTKGIYQQFSKAKITTPNSDLAIEFSNLFNKEKIDFYQVIDFKTAAWKKLIESASLGAITCLNLKTCEIFNDSKFVNQYIDLIKEAKKVAIADGANIKENYLNELIQKLKTYSPQKGSSMLADRQTSKPIEIGAKSGIIVQIARQLGIETPLHLKVVEQLEAVNSNLKNSI